MKKVKKRYTFVDLFAGIGGFRLAFERAGCECVFSSEWDEAACLTYAANFNQTPAGDITKIHPSDIPDHDILTAGFPCQPFSVAGVSKNNALGRKHGFKHATQGTLFFNIANIIQVKQPQAFVLENVKNLKSHDHGRTYQLIMWTLISQLGYTVYDAVLDSKVLVPQHRERIFLVGFREPRQFSFPSLPVAPKLRMSDILETDVDPKYTLTNRLWKYLRMYAEKHRKKGNGFGYSLVDFEGTSRTLSARYYKDGSEILVPQAKMNPRRLTPRECARLMGFPEGFKIVCSDTRAYKQFGNSVVVPLLELIARSVVSALQKKPISSHGLTNAYPVQLTL